MRRWWLFVLVGALVVSGCGNSGGPVNQSGQPTATLAPLNRSIRSVDFANVEWTDGVYDGGSFKLTEGKGQLVDGAATFEFAMFGEPSYADVDGDGDEDAAVGMTDNGGGGNGSNSYWYVWLWEDGGPRQLSKQYFAHHTRCGGRVDAVQSVDGGFEVLDAIWDGSTSCGAGKAKPYSYVVGAQDGFLVQTRPRLAPLQVCIRSELTVQRATPQGIIAYLAPDVQAPRLESRDFRELRISEYREPADTWALALLDNGTEDVCGWVRIADIP